MKRKLLAFLKILCLAALVLSLFTACSPGREKDAANEPEKGSSQETETATSQENEKTASQDAENAAPKEPEKLVTLISASEIPAGEWQAVRSFPDQNGYVDDTLAMNSMYSFEGYSGQGTLYFEVGQAVEGFDLFLNNRRVDTAGIAPGVYSLDISELAVNGSNTLQLSNIRAADPSAKVTVRIPYPVVIEGNPADVGLDEAPLRLIEKIISADIANGFSSAQLAVVKDGRLVYSNAWGKLNSYTPDGERLEGGAEVSTDTMYDLASNTKMYAAVYAFQYLFDRGVLSLSDRAVDILGEEFVEDTIAIEFASFGGAYPGLEKIKEWKARITLKDLLMHQAGFPDSGHYHNEYFDTVSQSLSTEVKNVLYVADADKEKTFREGICRTPLMYEPGTKTRYSDIDYMILGLVIEKVTGTDLDSFLRETYWQPMGLERVSYAPLEHGYAKEDCAATELRGNTRDGLIDFPGVRTETIQGEVHDEESYYMMEGMSGHAGLFASAPDLARLAFVMLSGGYGNERFFSKNTRDLFTSTQAGGAYN
ncbi:MAG: serine hydrolase [Firmicutes bacterium]|nr:serine hydrolase [Bacillota bacterium]